MPFGRHKGSATRPWRLSAKLLIASSVATVIGFSAICVSVMLDMRRGDEELARQTLENLASGIDADISRNIELYDLSLRAVASNMVAPEINQVSKPIRHPPQAESWCSRLARRPNVSLIWQATQIAEPARPWIANARIEDALTEPPTRGAAVEQKGDCSSLTHTFPM